MAFEAWLVLYLYGMLLANFNRKEHLQHRAVSLLQHGFLVILIKFDYKENGKLVEQFLADRTDGRAIATVLRLSSVVCL